jgi:hypothetical protein
MKFEPNTSGASALNKGDSVVIIIIIIIISIIFISKSMKQKKLTTYE